MAILIAPAVSPANMEPLSLPLPSRLPFPSLSNHPARWKQNLSKNSILSLSTGNVIPSDRGLVRSIRGCIRFEHRCDLNECRVAGWLAALREGGGGFSLVKSRERMKCSSSVRYKPSGKGLETSDLCTVILHASQGVETGDMSCKGMQESRGTY